LRYKHVYISGLCLGAVLGLAVAQERDNVAGVIGSAVAAGILLGFLG
jgi:Na+-transporting methylmalonyl-CoA/oxaloacetate decarboxylase beta subunit